MELNPRAKRWIGTIQNYDEHVVIRLEDLLMDSDKIKYGCYGKEIAPTTGTPHLHFFIHFRAAIRRNTVKTLIGSCWLDVARGSLKAIIEYIQKDGQFKEFGEKPIQTEEELQKIKDIKKWVKIYKIRQKYDFVYFFCFFEDFCKFHSFKYNEKGKMGGDETWRTVPDIWYSLKKLWNNMKNLYFQSVTVCWEIILMHRI